MLANVTRIVSTCLLAAVTLVLYLDRYNAAPVVVSGVETPVLTKSITLPQTYEYQIVSPKDLTFERDMAALGSAGWMVVFARRASDEDKNMSYEMIVQRPITTANP